MNPDGGAAKLRRKNNFRRPAFWVAMITVGLIASVPSALWRGHLLARAGAEASTAQIQAGIEEILTEANAALASLNVGPIGALDPLELSLRAQAAIRGRSSLAELSVFDAEGRRVAGSRSDSLLRLPPADDWSRFTEHAPTLMRSDNEIVRGVIAVQLIPRTPPNPVLFGVVEIRSDVMHKLVNSSSSFPWANRVDIFDAMGRLIASNELNIDRFSFSYSALDRSMRFEATFSIIDAMMALLLPDIFSFFLFVFFGASVVFYFFNPSRLTRDNKEVNRLLSVTNRLFQRRFDPLVIEKYLSSGGPPALFRGIYSMTKRVLDGTAQIDRYLSIGARSEAFNSISSLMNESATFGLVAFDELLEELLASISANNDEMTLKLQNDLRTFSSQLEADLQKLIAEWSEDPTLIQEIPTH